jgi:hypothetical protein
VTFPARDPKTRAIRARASSKLARTPRATEYGADGLKNFSDQKGDMASTTSGAMGVAAA